MRIRRIIKGLLGVILAFLIAGGVIYFLSTRPDESRGTVSIWYVGQDSLAAGLEELCGEYNNSHPRTTLPISLRAFESEDELAAACEKSLPDLILCPHTRAFDLGGRSLLVELDAELERAVDYPMALSSRNAAIGKSFFPVGCDIQVLLINSALVEGGDFESFADFAGAAQEYAEAKKQPYFAVDDYAALFFTELLREGEEFTGSVRRGAESENYKALYNLLAECAYVGALATDDAGAKAVCAGTLPCALTHTAALYGLDCEGVALCTIPPLSGAGSTTDRLGTAYGLAVTAGGSRSAGDIAAFLDWLFSGGRDTKLALGAALVPAQSGSISTRSDLWEALLALNDGSVTALPGSTDEFSLQRAEFDAEFRGKMAFLSE